MRKISSSVWIMLILIISAIIIIAVVVSSNSRTLDNVKLPIEITEFFDYRCSHCGDFYDDLEQVISENGDKVKVTYKHFPILGQESVDLAHASEAAELQDKFHEFHDTAFETYNKVLKGEIPSSDYTIEKVAAQIAGLDIEKFNTDRVSAEVAAKVSADISEGQRLGVSGTPTVFIFGKQPRTQDFTTMSGNAISYQPFKDYIKKLIEVAESKAAQSN